MKKLLFTLTLTAGVFAANAQQDPQFSQFMYDKLSINPGFAGIDGKICGTMFYRNQWMGFGNQPTTSLLNVHAPFPILRGGLGLTVYLDKLGFQKNTAARLAYSFHLPISPKLKLGVGLSFGYMGVGYNASWVAVDPVADDKAIPAATSSAGTMDFGVGAYLKGNNFYVGLSSLHLSESELKQLSFKNKRHYYLMAGYDYAINPTIMIMPALRVESDATATQVDLSVRGMWQSMVWAGVGYRLKEAVYPMVGYQKQVWAAQQGMMRIGISYDVNTNELKNYSNNGLEFFVNFCCNIDKPFKPEKYKTVRFL
ncbi:MAG TPA: type IX secretion system membrane protein PorP/SprF [Flavobacteriales bacterium]|nr:type IX secretion system membrane protein PorP/SprF [Flavobacteriales bacterium]